MSDRKRHAVSGLISFRSPAAAVTLADAKGEHILDVLSDTGWVVGGPKGVATRLGMKRFSF